MTGSAETVALVAPAKINLFLHLTGRRRDGYHRLDSIFLFTGLADRLSAERAPAGILDLRISGPRSGNLDAGAPDNLVLKAARALAARCKPAWGARLKLDKAIPVAAGLGGGSADAAVALKALARLWQLDLAPDALASLALVLGADVPPCLDPRPWRVGGIGEELRALDAPPSWGLVLVNPGVALPTARVFAAFRERGGGFRAALPAQIPWQDIDWLRQATANDLEAPARALVPEIGAVLDALGAIPECLLARMSGSGATCFGLFGDKVAAQRAAATLAHARPDWWVWSGGFFAPS